MNMKTAFLKATHPVRKLYRREHTVIGRQRLSLLLFCYLPILLIGVAANFMGLTQPTASFFSYTHTVALIAAAAVFWMFCRRRFDVGVTFSAFTILGQAIISIEMVYCALQPSDYYAMLIMANMVLLALNTMVAMAAYMKKTTTLLGFASLAVYIVCAVLADDPHLRSFIGVFTIAFLFVSLVGVAVAKSTGRLEQENTQLKKGEWEILHILRLKKNEVKTFVSLAAEKYDHDGTRVLLERLDRRARYNLLSNVEEYLKTRDTDLSVIARVFPELSPSEREIARLILHGKKLGDICLTLSKNESNVNSQRANMRRKLGLKPADNLQQALRQRLDSASSV